MLLPTHLTHRPEFMRFLLISKAKKCSLERNTIPEGLYSGFLTDTKQTNKQTNKKKKKKKKKKHLHSFKCSTRLGKEVPKYVR